MIRQVLANLLQNAFKFTGKGGLVSLQLRRDGEQAVLRVGDTGRGIPEAQLPNVFRKFWKGDGAVGKGAGLGLFISKAVVEAHQGEITVQSQEGQGTVFTVRLPLGVDEGVKPTGEPLSLKERRAG
jgi:signal transduction histidine kinase